MNTRTSFCRILAFSLAFAFIAVSPQLSAQSRKGVELYGAGLFREAETNFREAQKADPRDTANTYYLGLSILLQDRYREALDVLESVKQSRDRADQKTRPTFPDTYHINLALARARLGLQQYEEAWKNLEAARMEPNSSADVYVYRGVYYFQQDMFPEAIKELEKAISQDAKNPYSYYYEGLVYYKTGQPEKAVDALKKFLQLNPDAPEASKAKALVDQLC